MAVAVCLQRGAGTISLLSSIVILYQHGLFGSLRSRKWTSFINAASTNRHELEEHHTWDEDESSESARHKKDCPRDCLARVTSVHNNISPALKHNPSTTAILPARTRWYKNTGRNRTWSFTALTTSAEHNGPAPHHHQRMATPAGTASVRN
jgi:hypothetical protein